LAIYLDANFLQDGLRTVRATSLRLVARGHDLDLVVPQLALGEAQAHRRRLIDLRSSELEKALQQAGRLFRVPQFIRPDAARLSADWAHDITKFARVLPALPEHAAQALYRETERIVPAHQGTEARDAAIWLAIANDHNQRGEVGYFLSADKVFRDPDSQAVHLHRDLVAEITATEPLHLVAAFEGLLGLLTTAGGADFTVDEIRQDQQLSLAVSNAVLSAGLVDDAAVGSFGAGFGPYASLPPGIVSRSYGITTAVVEEVGDQTVYQLGSGREVAVVNTTWRIVLTVQVTAGARGFQTERMALAPSATLSAPAEATVRVQLWAQREPSGPPTFEIGSVGTS